MVASRTGDGQWDEQGNLEAGQKPLGTEHELVREGDIEDQGGKDGQRRRPVRFVASGFRACHRSTVSKHHHVGARSRWREGDRGSIDGYREVRCSTEIKEIAEEAAAASPAARSTLVIIGPLVVAPSAIVVEAAFGIHESLEFAAIEEDAPAFGAAIERYSASLVGPHRGLVLGAEERCVRGHVDLL